MAVVLHRTTKEKIDGVHTPDYPVADWIINPDLSAVAGVPVEYWKIVGDVVSEMGAAEKAAVDASLLPGEMTAKITQFAIQAGQLIESRYNTITRDGFAALLIAANNVIPPKLNRAAYIQAVINWGFAIQNAYETKKAEVLAMTTRIQVANAVWDTTALAAADPLHTFSGTLAIPD